jgi:hypothetical protein
LKSELEKWFILLKKIFNCGKFILKDGKIISELIPDGGSKDAYELYFELNEDAILQYYHAGKVAFLGNYRSR